MKLLAILREFDTGLSFNEGLNSALWEGDHLLPRVSSALKKIADAFISALEVDSDSVRDVVLTGSNANYNWSRFSDIDLHFALDYSSLGPDCAISLDSCLQAKKSLWNLQHDLTINGFPVEVYAHDAADNLVGDAAAYSLVTDTWIKPPAASLRGISVPQEQVTVKAEAIAHEIDNALDTLANEETLKALADKLWRMRQAGLHQNGEASLENLTFKALRNNGYVDKLRTAIRKAEDDDLSLKEHRRK